MNNVTSMNEWKVSQVSDDQLILGSVGDAMGKPHSGFGLPLQVLICSTLTR